MAAIAIDFSFGAWCNLQGDSPMSKHEDDYMPLFKGCCFGDGLNKDNIYLRSQGLTETQIAAIEKYLQKRLKKNTFNVLLVCFVLILIGGFGSVLLEVLPELYKYGFF